MRTSTQKKRIWFQSSFFLLFLFAPVLDIFRLDLNAGHFIFFGHAWTLQLDAFQQGQANSTQAVINLLLFAFLPLLLVAGTFIIVGYRWGRLYCGWLCPHYSVVELINKVMLRASGKPSLWEPRKLPALQADGSVNTPDWRYWFLTVPLILLVAFTWAVSLLTYLLPPSEIYPNLLHAELTRNQFIFISVATTLFTIEFSFARHLFCRFACAVGFFQSLAWMANPRAMVVSFDSKRGELCQKCNNACDNSCPMRLKARSIKRKMFTCTQCGECISACDQKQHSQAGVDGVSLLKWVDHEEAGKLSEPPVILSVKKSWKNK